MSKRLLIRILGAISSALIIVSVFVPYISVTGFSQSIWDAYGGETIYLPIMILAFGLLGVVLFAINKKVEFAYMSTGAVFFFIVMQTVQFIQENTLNTVSIGYYFLCIGTVLTGVMTFLNSLNSKNYKDMSSDLVSKNIQNDTSMTNESLETILPVEPLIKPIEPVMDEQLEQVQSPNIEVPVEVNTIEEQPVPETIIPEVPVQPQIVQQPIQTPEITPILFDDPVQPQSISNNIPPVQPEVTNTISGPIPDVNLNQGTPVDYQANQSEVNPTISKQLETDIFGQPINKK